MRTSLLVHGDTLLRTATAADGKRWAQLIRPGEGAIAKVALEGDGPISKARGARALLPDGLFLDLAAKKPSPFAAKVTVANATLVPDGSAALSYVRDGGARRTDLMTGEASVLWAPARSKLLVIGKPAATGPHEADPPASGFVLGDDDAWVLVSTDRVDLGRGTERLLGATWLTPGRFAAEQTVVDLARQRVLLSGKGGVVGFGFDGKVRGAWTKYPCAGVLVREKDLLLVLEIEGDQRVVRASLEKIDFLGAYPRGGSFRLPPQEVALAIADDGSLLIAPERGTTLVVPTLPDRWNGSPSFQVLPVEYERSTEPTRTFEAPAAAWRKALAETDLAVVTEELALDLDAARKKVAKGTKSLAFDALFGRAEKPYEGAAQRFAAVLLGRSLAAEGSSGERIDGDLVIAPDDHRVVPGDLVVDGDLEVAGKLTVFGDLTVSGFMEDHFTNPAQIVVGGKLTVGRALLSEGFLAVAGRVKAPFVILTFNQGEAKLFSGVEAKALVEADHGGTRVLGPVDVTWIRRDEARFDEEHEFDGAEKGKAADAVSKTLAKKLGALDSVMEIAETLWVEVRCARAVS